MKPSLRLDRASRHRLGALPTAILALALAGCGASNAADTKARGSKTESAVAPTGTATFAGGCFWCMEPAFESLPGVLSVTSGYAGGREIKPKYEDVSAGKTGHKESVQIVYDPRRITYTRLLEVFWRNIDPTQDDGQFCDHGGQYRAAIFCDGDAQRRLAVEAKRRLVDSKRFTKPIVTEILAFTAFYPAEEYHQDYYKKNPEHYHRYREGCGRDRRLRALWGDQAGGH